MKLLVLSDLHLDKPRGELKRFDIEDAVTAIESLKNYTEGIDGVIIAGDIFNAVKIDSVPINLLSRLDEVLKDIPEKYVIKGNHDRGRFSILEDAFGYTSLKPDVNTEMKDGITISGCDFTDIDTHREYLKSATSDILVCHFPMNPFSTFGETNIKAEECPVDKIVIVGDTHKPDVYVRDGRCVISPGCLFPADKTEILSGYAGSCFRLEIEKEVGAAAPAVAVAAIRLKTRFGADLSAISDPDELALGLKSIDARRPFPANLMPVAYVAAGVPRPEMPEIAVIPVTKVAENTAIAADFDGLEGAGINQRVRRILEKFFEEDDDQARLVDMAESLLYTDDTASVLRDMP
jgi:predicted phosphodiesterase